MCICCLFVVILYSLCGVYMLVICCIMYSSSDVYMLVIMYSSCGVYMLVIMYSPCCVYILVICFFFVFVGLCVYAGYYVFVVQCVSVSCCVVVCSVYTEHNFLVWKTNGSGCYRTMGAIAPHSSHNIVGFFFGGGGYSTCSVYMIVMCFYYIFAVWCVYVSYLLLLCILSAVCVC